MLLYPRLPRPAAQHLLTEIGTRSLAELEESSAVTHPAMTFAATGGNMAGREDIERVRDAIQEVAQQAGYPETPGSDAARTFDQRCGSALYEEMRIVTADAASDGVWAFLSCVVVPQVACWRFERRTAERILGGFRNTYRRLWWRVRVLGGDEGERLSRLNEDELVQVMERPTIGGNPRVAAHLCDRFSGLIDARPELPRMDLMRDSAKRLIRLTPSVNLMALDDEGLVAVIDEMLEASAAALTGSEVASVPRVGGVSVLVEETLPLEEADNGHSYPDVAGGSPSRESPRNRGAVGSSERPQIEADRPQSDGVDQSAGIVGRGDDGAAEFDDVQLGLLPQLVAEAVAARGEVEDGALVDALEESSGIRVPSERRRIVNKFAWSAKGRRILTLDGEGHIWTTGDAPIARDDRFGDWTLASLMQRAEELLDAGNADPFEALLDEVTGGGRAPRIVASLVGTAINQAKKRHRPSPDV